MDIADVAWGKFFDQRKKNLWEKFPGSYRAKVIEVNDPLAMNRIRFICPDMHDFDLKPDECPWANPSHDLGGKKSGKCAVPCIGDWVWITFEKQHPFGPLWSGAAVPLKQKYYSLPFVAEKPEIPPNTAAVDYLDYDDNYLPKDGRPLIYGHQDRYGNLDISSSIGFYPVEHDIAPPPPDIDPVNKNVVGSTLQKPLNNSPDKKYMLRQTKYGNMLLLGDQGYAWKKEKIEEDNFGEFNGDAEKDDKFESQRWLYIQNRINEGKPDSTKENSDQRRIELSTRYGHKIECRDVGWAQPGPIPSTSRSDEYGDPTYLSKEKVNDFRWIKIRTKGGMLFQAYDKGFDPSADTFVTKSALADSGTASEKEDQYWADRDARWIRIVSRHGYKFVIDDRGSDPSKSDELEQPSGNGILIKGRKSPSAHNIPAESEPDGFNPKGFYWEFNENEELNHSSWGSPNGQSIEINDRFQYVFISSRLGDKWAADHQGIKENEFIGKPIASFTDDTDDITGGKDAEECSHHLKIDLDNEYIRLKTRANNGHGPIDPQIDSGVEKGELNQGFEARDGDGDDGPWVEIVDCQNRGFWFSKRYNIGVWRSSSSSEMFQAIDDSAKKILIHNNEASGVIEIFCNSNVNVISGKNISLDAGGDINMSAKGAINFSSGSGAKMVLKEAVRASSSVYAVSFVDKTPATVNVPNTSRSLKYSSSASQSMIDSGFKPLAPRDRAKKYNGPFDAPDRSVIEHKIEVKS